MGSRFEFSRNVPLLRLSAAALAVTACSAVYQVVADARDSRRFPPPGRLAHVGAGEAGGGRRIHLMDAGQGSPTVVIVPALGEGVFGWVAAWRALSGFTRVCVYDRAGIGWSDPPPRGGRTFARMADDLHEALAAAGIAPPYVLVGHSMGGIVARQFAVRYRPDVAGMMLLDSSHEEQAARLPHSSMRVLCSTLHWAVQPMGLRRLAAAAGLLRSLTKEIDESVPAEHQPAAWALVLSSRFRRTAAGELSMMIRPHGRPPSLDSLPLTVITAAGKDPTWTQLQAELAALSTDSEHITASHAGHFIHLDEPDLVIKSIQDLLHRTNSWPEG